jgi:hypothetical protein
MNIRSVSVLGLLLLIISLMYSTVGVDITLLIFAIMFFAMAILFSIKLECYDKYLSFMNPGLYRVYSEKGNDFFRKKRIMNIISYYIISAMMGFNAFMQIRLMNKIDTKPLFDFSEFLPFALVVLVGMIIINYVSILITKKSKTANEDLAWNIIIGIVFGIIFIGFVTFNILRLRLQ